MIHDDLRYILTGQLTADSDGQIHHLAAHSVLVAVSRLRLGGGSPLQAIKSERKKKSTFMTTPGRVGI